MDVIDLSQTLHNQIQIYPGDPTVSISRFLTHEKDYCHVDLLKLGSHSGTHIDAPYHFVKDGKKIDEIPIRRFVGKGVLIDVAGKTDRALIETHDIDPYAAKIERGDFAIVKTGWDRYFGTLRYLQHPFLSAAAAGLLLDLGVGLVGIDAMNVDPTDPEITESESSQMDKEDSGADGYPVHDILLGNDILIVENLCNLNEIKQVKGLYSFLPLKLKDCDGSPIRAVFICGL